VGRWIYITHLLFVDDMLLFCFGNLVEGQYLKYLLDHLYATMDRIFNFHHLRFDDGFKYPWFNLTPKNYIKED
jgi:hypothetical protein